jgi:hypothetical protein
MGAMITKQVEQVYAEATLADGRKICWGNLFDRYAVEHGYTLWKMFEDMINSFIRFIQLNSLPDREIEITYTSRIRTFSAEELE